MSSDSSIFCFSDPHKKPRLKNHAGKLKNAPLNKGTTVRPGSLTPEICAGLLMVLFVRVVSKKTGKKK
jgi:hypothetical protein